MRKVRNTKESIERWKNKINVIYDAIEVNNIRLNEWEIVFLDSIEKQLSEGTILSWKQIKCLTKIYERVE